MSTFAIKSPSERLPIEYNTPKTRCDFRTTKFGSYLTAFCLLMDRQTYYLISLVHGILGFELLNHGTNSTIFNDIVCSDLTSHTFIIPSILLDRYKKVSVTGIGAIKGIVRFCRSGNRLSVGQMCCDLSTKAIM